MHDSQHLKAGRAPNTSSQTIQAAEAERPTSGSASPGQRGLVTNCTSSGMPAGRGVSDPGARQLHLPVDQGMSARAHLGEVGPRPGAPGRRCSVYWRRTPAVAVTFFVSTVVGPYDTAPGSIRCLGHLAPDVVAYPPRRPSTPAPVAFGARPADVSRRIDSVWSIGEPRASSPQAVRRGADK